MNLNVTNEFDTLKILNKNIDYASQIFLEKNGIK